MSLSAKAVAAVKERGRYGDGNGLYLQVTKTGAKSWLLRYQRGGRERWFGLGPLHTVSLAQARERARQARLQVLDGTDPIDDRRARRTAALLEAAKSITFEQAAKMYFAAHGEKWRNAKHRAQFLSTLEAYAFPIMGSLPVASVDRGLVLQVIEPIWKQKTETASRVRNRIEAVLNWAAVRGFRSGENPARWKGHLEHVLPSRASISKVRHHRSLHYRLVPELVSSLRSRQGVAARALEFTVLNAVRTGETIGATWDEVDIAARVWTIPAHRMKAAKEHRVPLSDRAIQILQEIPREDGNRFVFIGPRAGGRLSNMAMASVLLRMDRKDFTVHGLRSSFRDWAAECTSAPNHVVEQALAHSIGNAVERAYRRTDLFEKRRRLMSNWALHCTTVSVSPARQKVIPLRRNVIDDAGAA